MKTADFGYDGKGQVRITDASELARAWQSVGERESVLEAFVDFDCEISVVAARGSDGEFVHYGAIENRHRNGILNTSLAPARVSESVVTDAVEIAREVLEKLEVTGVLCVEFFVGRDGRLLINELAPRPHNSGPLHVRRQRDQPIRAAVAIGMWSSVGRRDAMRAGGNGQPVRRYLDRGEPNWAAATAVPNVKLHLYGKMSPRPGRKMGHLTALAASVEQAEADVQRALSTLVNNA